MRETTLKLEFALQNPNPVRLDLTGTGITKSTAASTPTAPATTVIHTDPAKAPAILPKAGDFISVTGTGWQSLDGKLVRVTAFDGTSGDLKISADTFKETTTPVLADIHVSQFSWAHVCLSEFSSNAGAPGEVDATTMCDTTRVTLPGLPTPGTANFTGMFDLDDAGMLALQTAYEDGADRWFYATTRRGQMAIFHGIVSAFTLGSLAVEGAVTFTGSFTLDRTPTYMKAS
jgi:hypothetical protein